MSINDIPADLLDLFDDYIAGELDEDGVSRLNDLLVKDEHARRCYILYSRTHTDLYAVARANRASHAALNALANLSSESEKEAQPSSSADDPRCDREPELVDDVDGEKGLRHRDAGVDADVATRLAL